MTPTEPDTTAGDEGIDDTGTTEPERNEPDTHHEESTDDGDQ